MILSLDADLLDAGPGKLRYARDFAARRRVVAGQTGDEPALRRREHARPTPARRPTTAWPLKARDIPALARAIAAGLGVAGAAGQAPQAATAFATEVVKDLQAHRGRALVVAGDRQPPAVHALAHAMNAALGNVGTTVVYTPTPQASPGERHAGAARAGRRDERRHRRRCSSSSAPIRSSPRRRT